ncbi:hypothetical protein [Halomicrococcus sp. NG-SE-24]
MANYKRPALTPDTHQQLDIYRAKHGYDTFNEAIEALLNEANSEEVDK